MAEAFDINSLNPEQRLAVETLFGPVLILAGAGTGKTRTVTCRIAHMISQGIEAHNILAVTFTNKAANEMRERVANMLSRKQAKGITVSTFHSLCVKILREECTRLGYKENFSIYTGSDQSEILQKIILRMGGREVKIKPQEVLAEISKVKNRGSWINDIPDEFIRQIAYQYSQDLRAQNAMDFDDLLFLSEKILRENNDVRQKWRNKFNFITVDEFQDTNALQMSLLKQLVNEHQNICVVGDDDQSIYGWRGADITNILQFEKFFPNPKIIKLEENYRCTKPILDVANSIIIHNLGRRDKQLRTSKKGGDPVRLIAMPGDAEEAEFVVDEIHEIRRKTTCPWEDFAILFRTNPQSRIIEGALREKRIPYRMVGAQSFYDRAEIKDMISYMTLMINPDSDLHLLRIIRTPARGIGEISLRVATDYSREHKKSVWQALHEEELMQSFSAKAQEAYASFVTLIESYTTRLNEHTENLGDIFQEFLEEIGYDAHLCKSNPTEAAIDKRRESVFDFVGSLRESSKRGHDLKHFLESVMLDSKTDDDDVEKKTGVCLITMHAAKGLEFPIVYLVGLEQGILPHKRSLEENTCDEERRLFYVGVTRAQRKLTLTHCAYRTRYGERVCIDPSEFIEEIPGELLEFDDYDDIMATELNEEEATDFFASLQGMIGKED